MSPQAWNPSSSLSRLKRGRDEVYFVRRFRSVRKRAKPERCRRLIHYGFGRQELSKIRGETNYGDSALQFVRVLTRKARALIFLIQSAPNQCDDPSLQGTIGGRMKDLGYDKPLYILPFDHRASFELKMFGWGEDLTPEQTAEIVAAKQVIYDGFKAAVEAGVPKEKAGILVDEQFGAGILRDAAARGYTFAYPVEKSGQEEFEFEYGDDFGKHIQAFHPTFCKVLVRYNPEGDQALNRRQAARLKRLSEYLHTESRSRFMFELLVPAEKAQLDRVKGDKKK